MGDGGAGPLEGCGGIILAVRAREHRDEDVGLCDLVAADCRASAVPDAAADLGAALLRLCREDLLQGAGPCLLRLIQRNTDIAVLQHVGTRHDAQLVIMDAELADLAVRNLEDDAAPCRRKQAVLVKAVLNTDAQPVSEGHLRDSLGDAVALHRVGADHLARADIVVKLRVLILQVRPVRHAVGIHLHRKDHQLVACLLELRRDHGLAGSDIHREAHQRRRDIDLVEGSGHGVLAADGSKAQLHLRLVRAQQRREGLAPAEGLLIVHSAEVLLEGKVDLSPVAAGSSDLRHGIRHREGRAVEGTPLGEIRVEAVAHHGDGVGLAAQDRQLRDHGLGLGHLVGAAVGHGHRAGADGAVEHLHQTLLRADVQVLQGVKPLRTDIGDLLLLKGTLRLHRHLHLDLRLLMGAVGVQERAADVDDGLASPVHHKTRALSDHCHRDRGQILLVGVCQELVHVLRVDDAGHTLLGLGDGDLRAVQARILLRDLVEVDVEARCQLADGDRNAAGAEVVALLDEQADLRSPEHALQLPLGGRVALLDLSAADLDGGRGVDLGGAGGTADAVAAGLTAEQDDDVARVGVGADHIFAGSGRHDGADLHALRDIIRMIDFFDITGRKTDLVSVGAVAPRRFGDQLSLGKLARKGRGQGHGRIPCAGDTHRLIDVGAAGQRVADGAAEAGRRTAEGLDLGRMVVGLVLEVHEPLFLFAVDLHRDHDGAGVDLVRLLLVGELSFLLQLPHGHQGKIHKADELVLPSAEDLRAVLDVAVVGLLQTGAVVAVPESDVCELGLEGGVAAVVRPVGIQHADLRHGGIPVLFLAEMIPDEAEIRVGHGQVQGLVEGKELLLRHGAEALEYLDVLRHRILDVQGLRLRLVRLSGIHGVDAECLDCGSLVRGDASGQDVGRGGADDCLGILIDKLHALDCGVCALVKLARKKFHGEDHIVRGMRKLFLIKLVQRRLGKDGPA